MQRPTMNPMGLPEPESPPEDAPRGFRAWFTWMAVIGKTIRWCWMVLWTSPLAIMLGQRRNFRDEDGSPATRFFRGLAYRLALLPLAASAVAAAIVWVGTHPFGSEPKETPLSKGLHFENVSFIGGRGSPMDAWLIPALDEKKVITQKNRIYRNRFPAVVLLHDFGFTREQVLPLVKPLHDKGMVVMAVALRGDEGYGRRGATFGLREAADVRRAIEALRIRGFVDPQRIGLVGIGTGAVAAVSAAESDPGLKAVVLAGMPKLADDVLASHVIPDQWYLQWMGPLCKWAFEISYRVDADAMDLAQFDRLIHERGALVLPGGDLVEQSLIEEGLPYLAETFEITPTGTAEAPRDAADPTKVADTR